MAIITAELISKLNIKHRCNCCNRIIFEGVIERGLININCSNCNNDNIIISTGNINDKFKKSGRSVVELVTGK